MSVDILQLFLVATELTLVCLVPVVILAFLISVGVWLMLNGVAQYRNASKSGPKV